MIFEGKLYMNCIYYKKKFCIPEFWSEMIKKYLVSNCLSPSSYTRKQVQGHKKMGILKFYSDNSYLRVFE